jgi:hypothetical protein
VQWDISGLRAAIGKGTKSLLANMCLGPACGDAVYSPHAKHWLMGPLEKLGLDVLSETQGVVLS